MSPLYTVGCLIFCAISAAVSMSGTPPYCMAAVLGCIVTWSRGMSFIMGRMFSHCRLSVMPVRILTENDIWGNCFMTSAVCSRMSGLARSPAPRPFFTCGGNGHPKLRSAVLYPAWAIVAIIAFNSSESLKIA